MSFFDTLRDALQELGAPGWVVAGVVIGVAVAIVVLNLSKIVKAIKFVWQIAFGARNPIFKPPIPQSEFRADGASAEKLYIQGRALAHGLAQEGVGYDPQTGVDYLLRAAAMGSLQASGEAAYFVLNGYGKTKPDYKRAYDLAKWQRFAPFVASPYALFVLGVCYGKGLAGLKVDKKRADAYLAKARKLAERNLSDPFGAVLAGALYLRKGKKNEAVGWFERGSKKGALGAINNWANACLNGDGVAQDRKEGIALLRKAAEWKFPEALYNLGRTLKDGDPERDTLWREAADAGFSEAAYALGWAMWNDGRPVDLEGALHYLRRAVEMENERATDKLGAVLLTVARATGGDLELEQEAYQVSLQGAERGNYGAIGNLAYILANGLGGVARDGAQALELYRRAIDAGDAAAMYEMGNIYQYGQCGVEPDLAQAVEWYSKAFEAGDKADAAYELAYAYYAGQGGLPKDMNRAFELFREAAEAGRAHAMIFLAQFYLDGTTVPQSADEARRWLLRVVKSGEPEALEALEKLRAMGARGGETEEDRYFEGKRREAKAGDATAAYGTGKYYLDLLDYREASRWILKAAELGSRDAALVLVSLYEEGLGVPKDLEKAAFWCDKIANPPYGDPNATEKWRRLRSGVVATKEDLQRKATNGDPLAAYELGTIYFAEQNVDEAARWFETIESKHPLAAARLVEMGRRSRPSVGITPVGEASREKLKQAINEGRVFVVDKATGENLSLDDLKRKAENDGGAAFALATQYFQADERREAERWALQAARLGSGAAMLLLACLSESEPDETAKDPEKSRYWFQRAAQTGEPTARAILSAQPDATRVDALEAGRRYCNDKGDLEKAIYWFERAFEEGKFEAANYLGWCFERLKDFDEARRWYQIAESHGDEYAKDALKRLAH